MNVTLKWPAIARALGLCMLASSPVGAQIGGGALAGTVLDQADAAVSGDGDGHGLGTNLARTTVTGPEGGYVIASVACWFDTNAFAAAAPFTIGTSSRNPVRGPGYRNLDLAAIRRVPWPGSRALELRVEVFNATNTPPLGNPNTTVGSAAFGTITSAGDPQVIQLAAKFAF